LETRGYINKEKHFRIQSNAKRGELVKDEHIVIANGFKSIESMKACSEAMKNYKFYFAADRDNFIKGWQARDKYRDENTN